MLLQVVSGDSRVEGMIAAQFPFHEHDDRQTLEAAVSEFVTEVAHVHRHTMTDTDAARLVDTALRRIHKHRQRIKETSS